MFAEDEWGCTLKMTGDQGVSILTADVIYGGQGYIEMYT